MAEPARRQPISEALRRLAPALPPREAEVVLDHAVDSPGLRKAKPEAAAWLSLVAYARHVHSDYDALLDDGYDPEAARHFARPAMQEALTAWGVKRQITGEEAD